MSSLRSIEKIIKPPPYHWVGNGFRVHNFMPRAIMSNTRMSPFFLLDYNAKMHYEPAEGERRGVGVHPHRGLETVTLAYHGKVAHHDSAGNGGIISQGDVQWMTAGKAILHKEYQEALFVKEGGSFQMVQLWVNLPAKHKMTDPMYQEITKSMMGRYDLPNNKGHIDIVAGEYNGIQGPARSFTPICLYNAYLEEGAKLHFDFPEHYNTAMLVVEGSVSINTEHEALCNDFILFENKGTTISVNAKEKVTLLIMSGNPIEEEIYPYGPFLMNTETEIVQAYEDYENGLFGQLDD